MNRHDVTFPTGEDPATVAPAKMGKNQFNFSDRAAQTFNQTRKERVVSTHPPETRQFGATVSQVGRSRAWFVSMAFGGGAQASLLALCLAGGVYVDADLTPADGCVFVCGDRCQWSVYDAYMNEWESEQRAAAAMAASQNKRRARNDAPAPVAEVRSDKEEDVIHSAEMGRALCVLERMVNQNAQDEIYQVRYRPHGVAVARAGYLGADVCPCTWFHAVVLLLCGLGLCLPGLQILGGSE